jgi:hypothetical protein
MLLDSFVAPLASFLAAPGPVPVPVPQFHALGEVRTSLYYGQRLMSSDFEPADEHDLFGIAMDVHEPGSIGSFELGYFYSSGDGKAPVGANTIDVESVVHEVWVGGRWTFDPWDGALHPYVGVGLSILHAEFETKGLGGSDSNEGWAVGAYGHGGIDVGFADGWSVGLDLRALVSTPATLQEETPLDYVQAAVTLSWTW